MSVADPPGAAEPALTDLQRRDHAVFWHPCAQMHDYEAFPPLEVASARGSVITLADGSDLIDGISSWWCKSLGHRHPGIAAAVAAQAGRYEHVITANTTSPAVVSLCERVLAACNGHGPDAWGPGAPAGKPPGPFGRCFFADNGSTGVEVALKMALQAQQQRGQTARTKLAALGNGYHGETAGAMSVSDLDLYVSPHGPLMVPVTKLPAPEPRSGPDDPRWLDASAEWPAVEAALDAEAGGLAAVVYEPVLQAAGGMRLYSPDLLTRLRRWADANGVYLIADEIAAGFGRLGPILASHLAPPPGSPSSPKARFAEPDFAVLSKGLTGGYGPMSVVVTTDAVYDLFYDRYATGKAFLHSNTFAGHALGVAAAHAALDAYATEGVRENVEAVGGRVHRRLREAAAARSTVSGVRRLGMVAAFELRRPGGGALDPADRTGYAVYRAAVGRGALLRPLGDTMYLFPPLNTPAAVADRLVDALLAAVDAVLGAKGLAP